MFWLVGSYNNENTMSSSKESIIPYHFPGFGNEDALEELNVWPFPNEKKNSLSFWKITPICFLAQNSTNQSPLHRQAASTQPLKVKKHIKAVLKNVFLHLSDKLLTPYYLFNVCASLIFIMKMPIVTNWTLNQKGIWQNFCFALWLFGKQLTVRLLVMLANYG